MEAKSLGAMLRIGCAGWSFRREQQDLFAQAGSQLQRYASVFDAVEVNSCFYRSHRKSTWLRWAESTPENFRFSYKLPKAITHQARLQGVEESLEEFLDQVENLGSRLGPLLVQLPPSFTFDSRVVSEFFTLLRRLDERRHVRRAVACEPRHASWFTPEASGILEDLEVAGVAAHPAQGGQDVAPFGFKGHVYYRLHGAPRVYYSAYSDEDLEKLADTLSQSIEAGLETWCIFDNTAEGHAVSNALQLMELMRGEVA